MCTEFFIFVETTMQQIFDEAGDLVIDPKQAQLAELKAQRKQLNKLIKDIDPTSAIGGKRAVKTNQAMNNLVEIVKHGKDLKKVSWGNSKESAQLEINSKPKQYKDWTVSEQDLDGDEYPDTIIYDGNGNPKIVNGYTLTKTKYPVRHMYTRDNPEPKQRRKQYDADGIVTNEGEYEKLTDYKSKVKSVKVNPDGSAEYINDEIRKLNKPLTPYKKFTKIIISKFWDEYKTEVPKHERMRAYAIVKKLLWNTLKSQIYDELGINIPENSEQRIEIEKQSNFKNILTKKVTTMLSEGSDKYHEAFYDIINDYLSANVVRKEGPMPERY